MKTFLKRMLVLMLVLSAVPALSAGLTFFTGPAGTNPINFPAALADFNNMIASINNTLNLASTNSTNVGLRPMGMIYNRITTVGTTTTVGVGAAGEQTLDTFTLGANTFDQSGRRLHIHADVLNAADASTKQVNLYVGSNGTGFKMQSGNRTDNNTTTVIDAYVTALVTTNSEMGSGWIAAGSTSGSSGLANTITTFSQSTPALTLTWNSNTAIPIAITFGTNAAVANEGILQDFSIEFAN